MVNYTYNAWGVVSSSVNSSLSGDLLTAANGLLVHNPYVYKGYYYDPRIHRYFSSEDINGIRHSHNTIIINTITEWIAKDFGLMEDL